MKTFTIDMVESDTELVVNVSGQGKVKFETVEVSTELISELRCKFIELASEIGEDNDPVKAHNAMFKMAIYLVEHTVLPKLTSEQALQLVPLSGGVNGGLVKELVIRFGLADLMSHTQEDDGGLQDEIPT